MLLGYLRGLQAWTRNDRQTLLSMIALSSKNSLIAEIGQSINAFRISSSTVVSALSPTCANCLSSWNAEGGFDALIIALMAAFRFSLWNSSSERELPRAPELVPLSLNIYNLLFPPDV